MLHDDQTLKRWLETSYTSPGKEIEDELWEGISHRIVRRRWRRISIAMAACAACLAAGLFIWQLYTPSGITPQIITRFAENDERIILPDGSSVFLQDGSTMSWIADMKTSREVTLKGSAVFDVTTTSEKLPFTINTGSGLITVKGTSFSVNTAGSEQTSVTLFSGKVDFTALNTGQTVSLQPATTLTYSEVDDTILIESSLAGITWRNGAFILEDAALNNAIEFMRWWFDTDITASTDSLTDQLFTGRIAPNDTPTGVLEKICFMLHLKYSCDNGKYHIYK